MGPIAVHVANGMYGAILVEPEEGLPLVDKEFAIVQSEFYAVPDASSTGTHLSPPLSLSPSPSPSLSFLIPCQLILGADKKKLVLSYQDVLAANPSHVVFNGKDGALTETPLVTQADSHVRIYFANAGPNLV